MKIKDRGYWISKLYKYQSFVHALQYALYFRRLTFFSAANPNIYLGGLLDEKKSDIYDVVPSEYVPHTMLCMADKVDMDEVFQNFTFPLILKPNVGYKGHLVKRVDDPSQLSEALLEYDGREILIQEFVNKTHEYSVMYHCLDADHYGVSSLVEKHLPVVIGNGEDSLEQLIMENANPFLDKIWLLKKYKGQLMEVLPKEVKFTIDHIGNYSRGAKFINLNHQIDKQLIDTFHRFLSPIQGFNFCRLDIKSDGLSDLKEGKFKLLEINGAKSEPLHIYDPSLAWWTVMKDIRRHWRILFRVVQSNHDDHGSPSTMEGLRSWRSLKKMMNG